MYLYILLSLFFFLFSFFSFYILLSLFSFSFLTYSLFLSIYFIIFLFIIIVDVTTSLLNIICEKHIIAGSGLDDDVKKLKALIPSLKDKKFKSINFDSSLFLSSLKKSNITISGSSLQNLSISLIGCNINKSETMSNWENRPLTDKQIQYAAIDSHISLHIIDEILKKDNNIIKLLNLPENIKVFIDNDNNNIEHHCMICGNVEYSYNDEISVVDNNNEIPEELFNIYGHSIPKECYKYIPIDEKCIYLLYYINSI